MSKPPKIRQSKRMETIFKLREMAKNSEEPVRKILADAAKSIEMLSPSKNLANSEEIAMMTDGRKILAVKSFRERMLAKGLKLGLRDCINILDDEVEKHRLTPGHKEKTRSGSAQAQKRGKGQRPKGKKSLKKDSK